jgi:preprotein translocase subunit YajC
VPEFLLLIGFVLIMWLFLIRPTSRRQKELRRMQSSLAVGDEVMLTSGVYGTVRELADDLAHVEIADGVTIRVARGAIGSTVSQAEHKPDEHDEHDLNDENETGTAAGSEEN